MPKWNWNEYINFFNETSEKEICCQSLRHADLQTNKKKTGTATGDMTLIHC